MTDRSAIRIRPIAETDSIGDLTGLLHRSYAVLGAMGLNYTAVDQSPETTGRRLQSGLALVAVTSAERVIGTIVYHAPGYSRGTPWLERDDVAHFAQFAVEPAYQGQGIGSLLLNQAEAAARADGSAEIALDTAETASQLIDWYIKRGYRCVEYTLWRGKTYRSAILSKAL